MSAIMPGISEKAQRLAVPPVGHEIHTWHIASELPVSRIKRSQGNGRYESTIPATLADVEFVLPQSLGADVEEAAYALAAFDSYASARLGAGSHVLGPMSTVLLRTEAASSSQIEQLTVGAKNLALETLLEGGQRER